jgi:hypothetical protein
MATEPSTEPIPLVDTDATAAVAIHPEDPDDEWVVEQTGRSLRVRYLTGVLVLLVAIGGGFWGGVVSEKHHGSGTVASGAASALASRFAAAARGASGTGTGGRGRSSPFRATCWTSATRAGTS